MNESIVSWKKSSLIFSSLFAFMIRLYKNRDVQKPIFVCLPQKKLKNSNPGSGWVTHFAILVVKQKFYEPDSIFNRNGKKKKKRRGHSAWSCVMNNSNVLRKKSQLFWLWMPTWETSVFYVLRPGATAHLFFSLFLYWFTQCTFIEYPLYASYWTIVSTIYQGER